MGLVGQNEVISHEPAGRKAMSHSLRNCASHHSFYFPRRCPFGLRRTFPLSPRRTVQRSSSPSLCRRAMNRGLRRLSCWPCRRGLKPNRPSPKVLGITGPGKQVGVAGWLSVQRQSAARCIFAVQRKLFRTSSAISPRLIIRRAVKFISPVFPTAVFRPFKLPCSTRSGFSA